jgi:hypothetical protein
MRQYVLFRTLESPLQLKTTRRKILVKNQRGKWDSDTCAKRDCEASMGDLSIST